MLDPLLCKFSPRVVLEPLFCAKSAFESTRLRLRHLRSYLTPGVLGGDLFCFASASLAPSFSGCSLPHSLTFPLCGLLGLATVVSVYRQSDNRGLARFSKAESDFDSLPSRRLLTTRRYQWVTSLGEVT